MSGKGIQWAIGIMCVLLSLCLPLQAEGTGASAKDEEGIEFFVRAVPDRAEVIYGDSCLVSYVLYASAPFVKVECKDEVKVKNARVRRLDIRREATSGYVVENGRRYHTLVWAQYVVAPERMGELILPACKFKAVLGVPEPVRDPFEAFLGRRRVREVEKSAANDKIHIKVKEKPRHTSKELLRRKGTFM